MPADLSKLKSLVLQLEKDLELAKEAIVEIEKQNQKEKKQEVKANCLEVENRTSHLSAQRWCQKHVKLKEQQH